MMRALLLTHHKTCASIGLAVTLLALPSSAFSARQQAKTTPEAFAEALVAKDTAMMAVLANGGLEDGDQRLRISAAELLSKVEGCRVGQISARTISLDCTGKTVGRPSGKCLTGDYTILFLLGDGQPTAASLSKSRFRTPECTFTPAMSAPTGSR